MSSHTVSADLRSSANIDFVTADLASLASHMNRCASAQGRFFTLKSSLQDVQELLSARIVTVGACVVAAAGLILFM
jgi:hypothetical protein